MTAQDRQSPDVALLPFLRASSDAEARRRLDEVLQKHALPVIRASAVRRMGFFAVGAGTQSETERDQEDLCGEAVSQVIQRLHECRANPSTAVIANLRAYAAATADHTWNGLLHRKYPQRFRIRNKLRYLLTHQPGLALWQDNAHEWIAGFSVWQSYGTKPIGAERIAQLRHSPHQAASALPPDSDPALMPPALFLQALFRWLGGPLPLDCLTHVTTALWGAVEPSAAVAPADDDAGDPLERLADTGTDIPTLLGQREYLEKLLTEIYELPLRQRHALLLNFRDNQGRGILTLFPITGAASIRRLSEILEMEARDLAVLWNELPLDDLQIAERLGLERQQVINLRRVARDRIARRMRGFDD